MMSVPIKPDNSPEFAEEVKQQIVSFNAKHWDASLRQPLGLKITSDNGALLAGLSGRTFGNWFMLDYLWVDDSCRGQGLGKRLVLEAENIARSRGCRFVLLDTLDFQARPFYQQLGYQLVFVQEDYPLCGKRYYLQKLL